MIHIVRTLCPAALDRSNPASLASKETSNARKFYSKRRKNCDNMVFAAYKHEEVKTSLEVMFHKKCAYCESRYSHIAPVDIEHYRPKGGVVIDGVLHWPGYWWLAADWSNLLPSCIDCNRRRRHVFDDEEDDNARGKENLFPLYLEKHRAGYAEGSELKEQPLLLDPCNDFPERYLDFVKEAGCVGAKRRLPPLDRCRSKQSILIYGLDRPELCESRKDHQFRVMEQAENVKKAYERLLRRRTKQAQMKLASEFHDLNQFLEDRAEYAAVARAFTRLLILRVRKGLDSVLGKEARLDGYTDCITWLTDKYPLEPISSSSVTDFIARINAIRS